MNAPPKITLGPGRPLDAYAGQVLGVRELEEGELLQLAEGKRGPARRVQKLRDSHHMCARLYAAGMTHKQVAVLSGRSINGLVMLRADPSFAELVEHYRADPVLQETALGPLDALSQLTLENTIKAARHIADRLDEADEAGDLLTIREALPIFSDGADRIGFGRKSTQVNVNIDFAAQLDRAIKRAAEVKALPASKKEEAA